MPVTKPLGNLVMNHEGITTYPYNNILLQLSVDKSIIMACDFLFFMGLRIMSGENTSFVNKLEKTVNQQPDNKTDQCQKGPDHLDQPESAFSVVL